VRAIRFVPLCAAARAIRFVPLIAATGMVSTGCPVAVTDTYTLEPEADAAGQGGASGACWDGQLNGDETDVDCGGPDCNGCPTSRACREASDCVSQACTANACE
jgi:hypothetical protein